MEAKPRFSKRAVLLTILVICVIGAVCVIYYLSTQEKESPGLKYATEGVVLTEEGDFETVLEPNMIALEFKNDAFSQDGQTFVCYLGNSELNERDMFIAIYADAELTDELYVSDMLRPGNAFNEIKLNRKLDEGDHRVYVAMTQMEDPETMHAQTIYTMDFHVLTD